MPSQDKLIKQGIIYTDKLFEEITKRIERGVINSDTLEEFLDKYNQAFPDKGNPTISLGYNTTMLQLILAETNNHKFSRPRQKELTRITIENYVGDLIVDIGDDIRDSVREIVEDGYNNELSQYEIANNISNRISVINNTRANALARTEIARVATVSDYIINKERGATHFRVDCRGTCCEKCEQHYHWGDIEYPISRTDMLPPLHPRCRCVAFFYNKNNPNEIPTSFTNAKQVRKELTELRRLQAEYEVTGDKLAENYANRIKRFEAELAKV
jgi:hypothetical protein